MSASSRQLQPILRWLFTPEIAQRPDVNARARMLVLDTIGCMLSGFTAAPVKQFAGEFATMAPGTMRVTSDLTLAPLAAAQACATAATWDEACEGLARAHGRPGVPVVAALVALAVAEDRSLGELLDAIVAGYEVGARMGEWLRNKPGMHVDAGWPSLGVAAGVARLLDCSADEGYAAMQTVACQIPVGLYAPARAGATARNTYLAHAVATGMLGAFAVAGGIDAPPDGLDDCARIVFDLDPAAAKFAPVGEYLLLQNYLKPFAAVRHVHYGVTAALALRDRVFMRLGDITKIELDIYPEALQYCGNRAPTTMIGAQFSLTYGLAAALRFGDLSPAVYRDGQFNEVGVRRLEALIQARALPEFGDGGQRIARIRVHLPNEMLERTVSSVKGDREDPFTASDCTAKFIDYAGDIDIAHTKGFADALLTGGNAQSVRTLWNGLLGS